MKLDRFLVISGVPGVHKLVSTRANGLVIEDRLEGRTRFVPVRQQQISPLASISIYTETEEGTIPLVDVFQKMIDQLDSTPIPGPNASSSELRAYFTTVLPEHDQDRVHINDIKKCVKWFAFMQEKGIFEEARREAEAENAGNGDAAAEPQAPAAEDTPAVADTGAEGAGPDTAHA